MVVNNYGYCVMYKGKNDISTLVHRNVMKDEIIDLSKKLNIPIRDIDVHHINGIKTDNRKENLEVICHGDHASLHHKGATRSQEYKDSVSKRFLGKPKSKETRRKMSEARKRFFERSLV